ncbi:MAG: SDR family NAD(P)-dependent oxidoreductase [Candidatus Coatesbacteria bacterium]|nr:SDR family NAD(P)-dependent oxidoreductase [Candidatus Coatesbacteria bacterium]
MVPIYADGEPARHFPVRRIMEKMIKNSKFLITGGTGSLGQTIAKTLLLQGASEVRIFSRDELKQAEMRQSLLQCSIRFYLGDVRDENRLEQAINGVDYVIHAAALKRIESGEIQPEEVIRTNVLGTMNIIEACRKNGIISCTGISTDKAVSPINTYGATKMLLEKLFLAASRNCKTRFSVCRYGNIIASRGSLLDKNSLLKAVIYNPQMTRFFIDMEAAATFVIRTLLHSPGGEICVLKMPSYRIDKIIREMARKKGLVVTEGIPRQAEKIHEILINPEETVIARDKGDYFSLSPGIFPCNLLLSSKSKSSGRISKYEQ